MCCIFTCCGWMIDLVQRAWVFFMSCCISAAVCCAVITASMSGVALGYNYSLAEYMELKETNVSVYLKRGVFDDEVVDEMDWRRGGGGLPAAARRSMEQTSIEPSSVPDFPFGHRRSNDEGMFATTQLNEPNDLYGYDPDHHRFEGSLMKLTAKPTSIVAGKDPGVADGELAKVMTAYPPNSQEQLKAIQGLMNRRVLDNPSNPIAVSDMASTTSLSGVSDEMQVIQKLLNEHKMAAKKFESQRQTQTPRPIRQEIARFHQMFPDLLGPVGMRRMGDAGQPAGNEDPISSLIGHNDPSKWYHTKQTETTLGRYLTRQRGPLTLSHTTTHKRIKAEDVTLTQDNFRRAMLDASARKDARGRDDHEKEVQNIINEPQKDYDEEDVKGFPVRRKRKKRNKRSNEEHSKSIKQSLQTENSLKVSSETGPFISKLIAQKTQ
ncbi:hypothetical protein O0L34_g6167 [Tuta absoluta]|nr:hypothetical protein O0L34_g6167 [Tuta absoluta]